MKHFLQDNDEWIYYLLFLKQCFCKGKKLQTTYIKKLFVGHNFQIKLIILIDIEITAHCART